MPLPTAETDCNNFQRPVTPNTPVLYEKSYASHVFIWFVYPNQLLFTIGFCRNPKASINLNPTGMVLAGNL